MDIELMKLKANHKRKTDTGEEIIAAVPQSSAESYITANNIVMDHPEVPKPKKARNFGTLSFGDTMAQISSKERTSLEKLKAIKTLDAMIQRDVNGKPILTSLDQASQTFYHKTIKGVCYCTLNCFAGDENALLKKYPTFPYSDWKRKCKAMAKDVNSRKLCSE
jgi:hypothetical protein